MWAWLSMHRAIDSWTVVHLALGHTAGLLLRRPLGRTLLAVLLGGVAWEVFELGVVEPLAGWHETWVNRWVFDLAADVTGGLLGWACVRAGAGRRTA